MTRERSGFADAKEKLHPTKRAAIVSDIETLLGNAGVSKQVIEAAAQLAPLLAELVEAEKVSAPAEPPRVRAVG